MIDWGGLLTTLGGLLAWLVLGAWEYRKQRQRAMQERIAACPLCHPHTTTDPQTARSGDRA